MVEDIEHDDVRDGAVAKWQSIRAAGQVDPRLNRLIGEDDIRSKFAEVPDARSDLDDSSCDRSVDPLRNLRVHLEIDVTEERLGLPDFGVAINFFFVGRHGRSVIARGSDPAAQFVIIDG